MQGLERRGSRGAGVINQGVRRCRGWRGGGSRDADHAGHNTYIPT